ncbi:MAG: hypothetical protein ACREA0_04690 [bacterium]
MRRPWQLAGLVMLSVALPIGCAASATHRSGDGAVEQTCIRRAPSGTGTFFYTGTMVDLAWDLLVEGPIYAPNAASIPASSWSVTEEAEPSDLGWPEGAATRGRLIPFGRWAGHLARTR